MQNQVNPYGRGKTGLSGELTHLYGMRKVFKDIDPAAPMVVRSGDDVSMRWVMNNSGTTLARRTCVKFKTGYFGTRIGDVCGSLDIADGVVDEFIPSAGVPDGYGFWMVEEGPCQFNSTGGGSLAEGDVLVTGAAGEVAKQTAAPSDATAAMLQVNGRVGRVLTATVAATAHLAFVGYFKKP